MCFFQGHLKAESTCKNGYKIRFGVHTFKKLPFQNKSHYSEIKTLGSLLERWKGLNRAFMASVQRISTKA